MYRYISRANCRYRTFGKIARDERKNDHERVQSSQAFSDLSDFSQIGRTSKSGTRDAQIQIINALRLQQINRAQEMLVDLSSMNNSLHADDFDYILEYCARTPDPLFVMKAWEIMVKTEMDMKKKSYRCIIQALSKGGYFKEAFEWISSLEESDHFHAGLPLCNIVLRECINKQSLIDVDHCLELMNSQLLGRSEITYWELLKMQTLGVEPSPHTFDGLIKAATYGRGLACGLKLMDSMERRGMKAYNDTLAFLSVEHSKKLELSKAESLLEMISNNLPKYIHSFNAFLVACDIMDVPERALYILAKLKRLNMRPNIRTFEVLFSLFGTVNAPYERGNMPSHMHVAERIRHIEMGMRRSGVQHSYTSMKNLIRALGMEGMITEMLQRLETAEKMLLEMHPRQITDMYNIILHSLVEAGHALTAIEYFQGLRSYGFLADSATYHIMLECCALIACFRSALALMSLMLRDGFFPHIMAYTAVVKVLLANNDFQMALEILNQASSDEIQLDVHLFNEILQQACTKISSREPEDEYAEGLINVIENIIEKMHHDNIKPDPSTCAHTFCSYAELGLYSTAVEALRVLSLRMISENGVELEERRNRFEELVCSEDPYVESHIISIFEDGKEYLAIGLLNLRWCTFVAGHPLSWSPEESLWSQRLSTSSNFSSK